MKNIPGIGTHYTDAPEVTIRKVKAGAAITKGHVVQWSATADDGITVLQGGANTIPAGIALEAATAAGQYIYIQTGGLGLVNGVTDGNAAAGQMLYAAASGAMNGVTMGSNTDSDYVTARVGLALADDSSTAQVAGTYIVMCQGNG